MKNTPRRIGHKMDAACRVIAEHHNGAAPSMLPVADSIGPNGSRCYGYAAVRRAIAYGLLALDPNHPAASCRGKGAVVLTALGREQVS